MVRGDKDVRKGRTARGDIGTVPDSGTRVACSLCWRTVEEDSYTTGQAARILKVTDRGVRKMIDRGELEARQDERGRHLTPQRAAHAVLAERRSTISNLCGGGRQGFRGGPRAAGEGAGPSAPALWPRWGRPLGPGPSRKIAHMGDAPALQPPRYLGAICGTERTTLLQNEGWLWGI